MNESTVQVNTICVNALDTVFRLHFSWKSEKKGEKYKYPGR